MTSLFAMELKKLLRISGEWQNHSLVSSIYIKHMSPKHYFNTPQWKFTLRFYSLSNGTNDSFVTYFKLSSSCAANTWSTQEPDWIKLAYSALIYLSGSSGGIYDIITWLNLTENPNKCITIKGARVAQWWEHSPAANVARVQIPASTPYVGWVYCWFSPLLREVFLRVLRFSPLLKN